MPRQMRIHFPGAIHHVMSRGDRRENIYWDDVDRQDLVKTLAEACQKTERQVQAYCLMRNHFHLVVEAPNQDHSGPSGVGKLQGSQQKLARLDATN